MGPAPAAIYSRATSRSQAVSRTANAMEGMGLTMPQVDRTELKRFSTPSEVAVRVRNNFVEFR